MSTFSFYLWPRKRTKKGIVIPSLTAWNLALLKFMFTKFRLTQGLGVLPYLKHEENKILVKEFRVSVMEYKTSWKKVQRSNPICYSRRSARAPWARVRLCTLGKDLCTPVFASEWIFTLQLALRSTDGKSFTWKCLPCWAYYFELSNAPYRSTSMVHLTKNDEFKLKNSHLTYIYGLYREIRKTDD